MVPPGAAGLARCRPGGRQSRGGGVAALLLGACLGSPAGGLAVGAGDC